MSSATHTELDVRRMQRHSTKPRTELTAYSWTMYRMVSLEQTFSDAAEAMARPAGRRPEFESLEAIAEHRKAFVLACHETWRVWHGRAIEQILTFDQFLRANKTAPVPGGDEIGNHICA